MNFRKAVTLPIAIAVSLTGSAAIAQTEETVVDKPVRIMTSTVKTAVIVESVNLETREIRVIDATGNRFGVIADPAIPNIDKIKPRDRIITEHTESVAIVVTPAGAPELPQGAVGAIAEEGTPAVAGIESVMVRAIVASLNVAERRATLVDEEGNTRTIRVAPETPIELVEVGDEVRVRITQAVAISIERPDA